MAETVGGSVGKLLALAGAIFCALILVHLFGDRPQEADSTIRLGRGAPPAFSRIVEEVLPAVVSIEVERSFRHSDLISEEDELFEPFHPEFDEEEYSIPSSGSGFVIDPEGLILTNDHVVREGQRIHVHFSDDRTLEATIIGRDPMTDLAVIRVESERPLTAVRLGDSDRVRLGDWVVAIGNPLGMLEGSVSFGIVSGKGRTDIVIRGGGPSYQDFIQTDAAISPGSSGGPLINDSGEVIGINTAYDAPGRGIGFAVSMKVARGIAQRLIEDGRVPRGFLGVSLQELDRDLALAWDLAETHGIVITDVQEGTPASAAGLEPGDVIIEFDQLEVARIQPFRLLVAGTEVGRTVSLRYLRRGRPHTVQVQLVERNDPRPSLSTPRKKVSLPDFGLYLSRSSDSRGGVLIDSLRSEGPGSRAGFLPGDRVIDVGWRPVEEPSAMIREVERQIAERGAAALQVDRGGFRTFLTLRSE